MWNERSSDDSVMLLGGVALDDGVLSEATLRPLTGHEEEWLAQHPSAPSALVTTRLLSACLVRLGATPASPELVERLLVGDRDYLILQLRRLTLGETVSAVLTCPVCDAKMDVDFRIGDVPVEQRPQTAATFHLELTRGEEPPRTVRYRLPAGADQEAVLDLDGDAAVDTLLARCMVDDGGSPLSPDERTAVIDAMEQHAPQLELELELTCPECDRAFTAAFDTTTFFFDEMRGNGTQLLREVHHLAFHYHWSEAEILSLTRKRRRIYLALLSDALRQD